MKLANPLSAELGYLRRSILPGLVELAKRNHSRGFRDLALFESGAVFLPGASVGTESIPPLGIRPDDAVLDGPDALAIYERNWRHVDAAGLTAEERRLLDELVARYGAGVSLV